MRSLSSLISILFVAALLLPLGSCELPTYLDEDGDGFTLEQGDCDDGDPAFHPLAVDLPNNGIDEDCSGHDTALCYLDADNDSFGGEQKQVGFALAGSCEAEEGLSSNHDDCADNNSAINPGATEICDALDNNCNGEVDEEMDLVRRFPDLDGDGYGDWSNEIWVCPGTKQVTTDNSDCDDQRAEVFPGHDEICDGLDNDCNQSLLQGEEIDEDGDGFPVCSDAPCPDCDCSDSTLWNARYCGDCDDNNPTTHPGSWEQCNDQTDNDCDGATDEIEDSDGDQVNNCLEEPDLSGNYTLDCNDGDASIHPGAEDLYWDCIDQDCDGFANSMDADGDGYQSCSGDCDDNDDGINPSVTDVCDGLDNDCDGRQDEDDATILLVDGWAPFLIALRDLLRSEEANGGYCVATIELDDLTQATDLAEFELVILGPDSASHNGQPYWPPSPNAFTDIVVDSYHNVANLSPQPRPAPSILTMGYTGKVLYPQLIDLGDNYDWDEDGSVDGGSVMGSSVNVSIEMADLSVQCEPTQIDCSNTTPPVQGRPLDTVPAGCTPLSQVSSPTSFSNDFYTQPDNVEFDQGFAGLIDVEAPDPGRAYPLWSPAGGTIDSRIQQIGSPPCPPAGGTGCWDDCGVQRSLILREEIGFTIGTEGPDSSNFSLQPGEPWLYHWGFDALPNFWTDAGTTLFFNVVHWAAGCPPGRPDCND